MRPVGILDHISRFILCPKQRICGIDVPKERLIFKAKIIQLKYNMYKFSFKNNFTSYSDSSTRVTTFDSGRGKSQNTAYARFVSLRGWDGTSVETAFKRKNSLILILCFPLRNSKVLKNQPVLLLSDKALGTLGKGVLFVAPLLEDCLTELRIGNFKNHTSFEVLFFITAFPDGSMEKLLHFDTFRK